MNRKRDTQLALYKKAVHYKINIENQQQLQNPPDKNKVNTVSITLKLNSTLIQIHKLSKNQLSTFKCSSAIQSANPKPSINDNHSLHYWCTMYAFRRLYNPLKILCCQRFKKEVFDVKIRQGYTIENGCFHILSMFKETFLFIGNECL